MSQRVNITLPDELFERLQQVKDKINVSRICQRAIDQAIYNENKFNESISDKEKLILRLRKEREEFAQEYKKVGFADGLKDAANMHFDSFRQAWLYMDAYTPEYIFGLFAGQENLKKVAQDSLPEITDHDIGPFVTFDNFRDLYFDGWLDGVLTVWEEVKDELATYKDDFLTEG